ncbi:PucR family transcriptional regulator, partial [Mycolicibacterium elephantis]
MVTLDRLVNVLGSYGVRLRFCPVPRSTELSSVVMHEAVGGRTVVGDVLLAIGARSVKEAVRWAVSARAIVVLLRSGDDDATFSGMEEGVAVMALDP